MSDAALATQLGPLALKNPVLVSSGTFGTGIEYRDFFDLNLLGGLVTKAVTLEPRPGNPPPRIAETPSGILNAIGLENVGLKRFIAEKLPFLQTLDTAVIVNVAGTTADEYVRVAAALCEHPGISALELNISCPNVKKGGQAFGVDPALTADLVSAVRRAASLPLIVKLTPNVTDMAVIARAALDAGADILSLVNTFRGMAIDIRARRPVLGNVTGGLSGPAIRPLALQCVYHVSSCVEAPVIGMGGICGTEHALEFMMAGAAAVSVGTANLIKPDAAAGIVSGLSDYCRENGLSNISQIVGAAHGIPHSGRPRT
jgi:dihydroorotate dehydrogenase (NAD+) catalytic subunit